MLFPPLYLPYQINETELKDDILNIDLLKPYKVKANLFKKEWKDDFIPERNFSISTIDQLFSDDPYKIPN